MDKLHFSYKSMLLLSCWLLRKVWFFFCLTNKSAFVYDEMVLCQKGLQQRG